jgi:hypothetical protein
MRSLAINRSDREKATMIKRVPALALILFAAIFAYACEEKGPAEKAGEKIDDAVSETADAAEDAGEAIEEAAEEAADKMKGD